MEDINYNEVVTLLMPDTKKIIKLAAAVREVIYTKDALVRLSAVIARDGWPTIKFDEIDAIYARPDFPDR